MFPSHVIMIPMLLISADSVVIGQDDSSNITNAIESSRPNQYPPITGVVPIDLETPQSFDDWPWGSSGITGNWGGVRDELIEHGIHLNGSYTALMFDNFRGGFDTGFFGGGITQLELTVETEKTIGLEGGLFFMNVAQMTWYSGRFEPPGSFSPTGSVIGVDSNFPPNDQSWTAQVNQFYWRQSLGENALQITFGKIDANATFAAANAAGGFQNGLAASPSSLFEFLPTYPNPAMGLQIDLQITPSIKGHFGWWDGTTAAFDPVTGKIGPPTGDHGVGSFFDDDDHWLVISQFDFNWALETRTPGELSIGGWFQTGTSATKGDSTTGVEEVPGWYVNISQTIWSRDENNAASGGGIQLFGSVGWSPGSKNANTWSVTAGVSATGVIPGRNSDALGVMMGTTVFSNDSDIYRSTMLDGMPGPAGGSETIGEVFYRIQLTPAMMIQPGLEWVIDPGGGSPGQLDDAFGGYLAIMINF
jgi:porin